MTILITGILLIIISLLFRKNYSSRLGFLFILMIMGFQSNVDGDYMSYMDIFNYIKDTGMVESKTMDSEPVLPFLMKIFSFGPFWLFILAISIFECFILIKFTQNYCSTRYQYVAAILFFFTFSLMLLQMKAIRQGLSVEFCVLAFMMLDKWKKNILSFILVITAFFIHNSSIIIVPFIIISYFVNKKKEKVIISENLSKVRGVFFWPTILTVIFFALFLLKKTVLDKYIAPLSLMMRDDFRLMKYLDKEMAYQFDISILIVLYNAIIVFLVTWYYQFADHKKRVLLIISIIAAFGDMLFFGLGALPRMLMFFTVFNIVVYPQVAEQINKKWGSIAALLFIIFIVGYAFKTSLPYMLSVTDDRFGTFKFIFCK